VVVEARCAVAIRTPNDERAVSEVETDSSSPQVLLLDDRIFGPFDLEDGPGDLAVMFGQPRTNVVEQQLADSLVPIGRLDSEVLEKEGGHILQRKRDRETDHVGFVDGEMAGSFPGCDARKQ